MTKLNKIINTTTVIAIIAFVQQVSAISLPAASDIPAVEPTPFDRLIANDTLVQNYVLDSKEAFKNEYTGMIQHNIDGLSDYAGNAYMNHAQHYVNGAGRRIDSVTTHVLEHVKGENLRFKEAENEVSANRLKEISKRYDDTYEHAAKIYNSKLSSSDDLVPISKTTTFVMPTHSKPNSTNAEVYGRNANNDQIFRVFMAGSSGISSSK